MEERRLDICIREWLEETKTKSVKTLTYDRLLISLKLMGYYMISSAPVSTIDSRAIQRYVNRLVDDGYSLSTVKKQFNLITGYWKWAMSQGLVGNPVYLGVKLPSKEIMETDGEVLAYDHIEQDMLLDRLMTLEKPQYAAAILMIETGMRIGEVLALTWNDVLWGRRAIRIHRTLIRLSSEAKTYVQESPKSKSSRRTIPLSDTAMEVLRRLNICKSSDYLIFARPDKPQMPYSYSSIEFHIRHLCKDLGISYKGLHAFRHTFATNCYERGCDVKILSKLLGHADVAITYNIYIHLYGDALEEMRKVIS